MLKKDGRGTSRAVSMPEDAYDPRDLKKQKTAPSSREIIQLGSPSLAQFESAKTNSEGGEAIGLLLY